MVRLVADETSITHKVKAYAYNPGTVIGIDFETYSDVDIKTYGLDNYFRGEHFKALLVGISLSNIPVTWDLLNPDGSYNDDALLALAHVAGMYQLCAHNSAFEEMVFNNLDIQVAFPIIDTAVAARSAGASSSLGRASQQLLGMNKVALGEHLIQVFCVPSKDQREQGSLAFDPAHMESDDWEQFHDYCGVDAHLSRQLYVTVERTYPKLVNVIPHEAITRKMNRRGWMVDIDKLAEMQAQVEANNYSLLYELHSNVPSTKELNLNSPKQLYDWCRERGVKAKSFDKLSVDKMSTRIDKRLQSAWADSAEEQAIHDLDDVYAMLQVKKELGGSAVSKLDTIDRLVSDDGILRDNYIHVGAGQTWRTTGVGVQMQNLKRLGNEFEDLDTADISWWDNDTIGDNLRQLFTAHKPDGKLIVADYSSIEAVALAHIAGDKWVVDAFRRGEDLYKAAAAKRYGIKPEQVSGPQRTYGKVGVLSCGYGAGYGAVQSFAEGMGIQLTDYEAAEVVQDFRDTRPETVAMWNQLNSALEAAVSNQSRAAVKLPMGEVRFTQAPTPQSLLDMDGRAKSILMTYSGTEESLSFSRIFHGCYIDGKDIRYYRAMAGVNTELWRDWFTNPKTKQRDHYKLYGGKLAGILVQSYCREIFMAALARVEDMLEPIANAQLIGQFHDEIVLDWAPVDLIGADSLGEHYVMNMLRSAMESVTKTSMPLRATVASSYRYIK